VGGRKQRAKSIAAAARTLLFVPQSKVVSSTPPPWRRLFGQPIILEGEDAATYEELLARIRAAIKSVDIIEEMFIATWCPWSGRFCDGAA
jgi:hypothetical protein